MDIQAAIQAVFSDRQEPVTRVYWRSEELFKPGKDSEEKPGEPAEEEGEDKEEGEES